ncbi:Protein of unknown function [Evansella caseinilytica]|uniref:DUF3006 domain-containing protein n=1 Tax=Evansella caseinilytica TaxID=1503961 RepID=A0A1H3TG60_9BACI|nr:DUF3006 domain-containing protein [Evansella caseinilytica]SDZ49216.1 Protein of unknown function [Evansella caseinilytica]
MTGIVPAVLERIVEGRHAVFLIGDEEKEAIVPVEKLPVPFEEGEHFLLHIRDGVIDGMERNEEKTAAVKSRVQKKMKMLQNRQRSRYKQK